MLVCKVVHVMCAADTAIATALVLCLSSASIRLPACLPARARCAADTSIVLLLPRCCYCARLFAFSQHNTLPVIFKPEMPSRIGLLPLTARSGDEVRRQVAWHALCEALLVYECLLKKGGPAGRCRLPFTNT
jgi:hypothetical protein